MVILKVMVTIIVEKQRWAWGLQLGGGSGKFWSGGVVFGPQGGNKFRLSEGGFPPFPPLPTYVEKIFYLFNLLPL